MEDLPWDETEKQGGNRWFDPASTCRLRMFSLNPNWQGILPKDTGPAPTHPWPVALGTALDLWTTHVVPRGRTSGKHRLPPGAERVGFENQLISSQVATEP